MDRFCYLENYIIMEKCQECNYDFETLISVHWDELERDFQLEQTYSGPCWAGGNAICKKCKKEFDFSFEDFIYDKLMLRPRKLG